MNKHRVVIVGGGFAGMTCAKKLINNPAIHVTLIDRNNYHEFTPLLYQVATSSIAPSGAAIALRHYFSGKSNIDIKMGNVTSVDPQNLTVKLEGGESYTGDSLILAAGSVVNFFGTAGAEEFSFPLYTLNDAERLRSRILAVFEDADRNPSLIEQGALNFVIVGAGPTGTEIGGAISDMLHIALPKEFSDLALEKGKVFIVNHGDSILGAFSKVSQVYAKEILTTRGVELVLGELVKEVTDQYVVLSNGEKILTKTVIWAGGLKASPLEGVTALPQGHGGRINVRSDLTVEGFPNLYVLGDLGVIPGVDGAPLPQLGSVAQQTGEWAAKNLLKRLKGEAALPFQYNDKGIMAMIGKNAAIVELGKKRRELKGIFAYLTWLSVHVALLSTFYQKIEAIIGWVWSYFGYAPALQILDRKDAARINWMNKTDNNQ